MGGGQALIHTTRRHELQHKPRTHVIAPGLGGAGRSAYCTVRTTALLVTVTGGVLESVMATV